VTDEEEVVRALWYPGEVGVTGPRDVETKDVTEDFWRYACDFQQRVSSAFELDNFCIRGRGRVKVGLVAHLGDLNALCQVSDTLWNALTHVDFRACFSFEPQAVHRSVEGGWCLDVDHRDTNSDHLPLNYIPPAPESEAGFQVRI